MEEKELKKVKAQRKALRDEVFEERYVSKARTDYYGERASSLRCWMIVFNAGALLSSSGAILSVVQAWGDKAIIVLSLIAAVSAVVSAVVGFNQRQAAFLAAQTLARSQEIKWDILWNDLNLGRYNNIDEIFVRYNEMRKDDATVQQIVQPHVQKSKRVQKIQEKIKEYMVKTREARKEENNEQRGRQRQETGAAT